MSPSKTTRIAFQGELGAYSHEACISFDPSAQPVPCHSFEAAIAAVQNGDTDLAMLPIENSTYGRVADNHRLIPDCGLFIRAEAFVRVRIALMANSGAKLDAIKTVRAHPVLLPQSAVFLKSNNITGISAADSAGAAADLAASGLRDEGVLASVLAADIHGLEVLAEDIEDHGHNTTRFVIMGREADYTHRGTLGMMTTFVFEVRNIPAALYKAMGGFATNSVNMTKLESYMVDGAFTATRFYADIDGHPDDANVQLAMEELGYFTSYLEVLGTYPADRKR